MYYLQEMGLFFVFLQKAAFQDAQVGLFVFDCIYFNGISLMDKWVMLKHAFS